MTEYKVKLAKARRPEFVMADYYRIDDRSGAITFRCFNYGGSYPVFVKCFAAGTWLSVENHTLAQQRKGETS